MKSLLSLITLYFLLVVTSFQLQAQGYYKSVIAAEYGISSQLRVDPIGYHFGDSTTQVAFEYFSNHSSTHSRFFGTYSPQGDLLFWHPIPNASHGENQQIIIYDSLYVQYKNPHFDSSIVSAIDHSGTIIWTDSLKAIYDAYANNSAHPANIFVLNHAGYYSYLHLNDGSTTKIWRADSLHQALQSEFSLDSLFALERVGESDTATYFRVQEDKAGNTEQWLLRYRYACSCWDLEQSITSYELLPMAKGGPLLFDQSVISLAGDSSQYTLALLDINRDTLWFQNRTEVAYRRSDSTVGNQYYTASRNAAGFFLLERPHARWADDSFLPNQYQLGIKYRVLDSAFNPVVETTVWPTDAAGKVIDEFYSLNYLIGGPSKFKVEPGGIINTIINRDQRGLGAPIPMFFQTGVNGYTFLHQSSFHKEVSLPVKLYPNPAEDHIVLETNVDEKFSYSIINNLGQTVMRGAFDQNARIDLSGLKAGSFYIVLQKQAGDWEAFRFLVIR